MQQSARIHAKHGIILDCVLESTDAGGAADHQLETLAARLAGQKYAFVDERRLGLDEAGPGVVREAWAWLKAEMEH